MNTVWIVDDDRSIRWVLEKALGREDIPHRSFSSASEALAALEVETHPPKVLISDIRMPGESGLGLLKRVKALHPQLPVIIMTAYSDLESAVSAFQGGAFEYLPKPFDVDQAVALVQRAIAQSAHQTGAPEDTTLTPEILGQAPAMQEVFRAIGRLAQSHATVLINGESGSGKELVARALHRHSPRREAPFIAINTAAIPRDLLESELFGHERGAFTGAAAQRRGRFEQAEGGTLFLDEIGDMPAELQTRLLRVLSDNHFYRVGGQQPIRANVRVIAATHQNLEDRVRQGLFREDLFHRLNVIRLRLPPLRERHEDIPILVRHFLQRSAQELGVEAKRMSDAAIKYLQAQPFPGNVRQLENLCHWLTVMAPGQTVEIPDLPPDMRDQPDREMPISWSEGLALETDRMIATAPGEVFDRLTREFERTLIRRALSATGGRRIEAAQLLGIGRNTITRKIQELGMDDERASAAEAGHHSAQ
ncbi:MAG TPA: nitrogen regulation protein NR(I) [Aromatoleum sp.]|uniref:nitrogen regulation protein NR(I) n=1 Tax=Aromatoleum sp. TaxID=2307007 RepID=UPI002B47E868|nr:nitrogen regulation protein NR(I) [Aromatoleum sp.]HJV27401.1 nitrogen regulation protein NR(I) [Aromatoleum sp.]